MSDVDFTEAVESIGKIVDWVGVGVIVIGLLLAILLFVKQVFARLDSTDTYRAFRQRVGKAILLGLEFLVAADIIRTVAVAPSFRGVGVLALIVLVRTFLSFTLEVEIEGRWPWQRAAPKV
ncbi:MAG: DUF1622 domain-containing protein [Thermoleophilaceae bacterium]|nr:DUF1622 domain-containing protein [Thermoleophilaceae bacterium]